MIHRVRGGQPDTPLPAEDALGMSFSHRLNVWMAGWRMATWHDKVRASVIGHAIGKQGLIELHSDHVEKPSSPAKRRAPNNALEPTGLIGKHFAKMKSKMLTNEARGSAQRWIAISCRRELAHQVVKAHRVGGFVPH